jgi:hypothetical protein
VHTKHVSWAGFEAKDFLVLQRLGETEKEVGATLEAVNGVCVGDLQATCHGCNVQLPQSRTVDLTGLLGVAAECAGLEHLETGYGETLAAAVDLARLLALVLPLGSSAGVEEDGDEEQVQQATCPLLVVDSGRPRGHELVDSRSATHVEVLPPTVRGDGGVVRRIVAL